MMRGAKVALLLLAFGWLSEPRAFAGEPGKAELVLERSEDLELALQAGIGPPKTEYGQFVGLSALIEKVGFVEEFPIVVLGDFGISSEKPISGKRILVESKSKNLKRACILLKVSGSPRPHLILVSGTYKNEGKDPLNLETFRIDETGAIRWAAMRHFSKDREKISDDDAMNRVKVMTKFWNEYVEKQSKQPQ